MTGAVRSRWAVVIAYACVAAMTQVLWVTFAPVTTEAAAHYGVSTGAVGWLAQVFPLAYVVLAVPAGLALDRWFRAALLAGALLSAAGALLRVAGDGYGWALLGQVVIALGQPLVLNAITGVVTRYLAEEDRPVGIAVGSAGTFAGLIAGFALGAVLAHSVRGLLLVQAVLAVAVAVALALALRAPGSLPAGPVGSAAGGWAALRAAWSDRYLRRLCAVVLVPFGAFVALTTWVQPLLEPAGVPESAAALMLVVDVVAGVAGCAVLPVWAARRDRRLPLLAAGVLVTAAACLVLALAPGVVTGFVALTVVGAALLPALPVVLELTERRAGAAEGTAAGLVWLSGNLGGLLVAVVVGLLVGHPGAAFVVLAAVTLLALPLLAAFARTAAAEGARETAATR